MNKREENKMSMYLTVQKVTNYHSDAWKELTAFKNLFNEFERLIQKIKETRLVQERKITGVTKDKKEARNSAVEKGLLIAGAVYTYTSVIGNNKAADRVSYKLNDFNRGRDTIIIDRLRIIHEVALQYVAEMDDYGVTQEDLDELAGLTEKYAAVVEDPRQAITNRARATKQLKDYLIKADTIVKNRLDRLINQFKANSPDFWQQFKNARKIVDLGYRKKERPVENKMTESVIG